MNLETLVGQILALLTLFAFPAIQYIILKRFSKKGGRPELWYLPAYGFRLVIRNMTKKRTTLSDIKYRTRLRKIVRENSSSSVSTLIDEIIINKEDFFLFPGYDQIILCFQIVGLDVGELRFVHTDNLGKLILEVPISQVDLLISDYTANIENYFNFDVKIGKRVIIERRSLIDFWAQTRDDNRENKFEGFEIIDVG